MRTDEKPIKYFNRKRRIIEKLRENEAFNDDDDEIGEQNGSKSEAESTDRE